MTVLTIRTSKRYAVRQGAQVSIPGGQKSKALLIELSVEGCRVSNVRKIPLSRGEPITLRIEEAIFEGHVRWAGDGVVGVRFDRPLFADQLSALLESSRHSGDILRYGT